MSVTLSLRVTCDKRKPGVKPSSPKEENIHHVIERLRSLSQDVVVHNEFLDELEKAGNLKSQLEKLKQGSILLKCGNEDKEQTFYYTTLVEILLSLELKSPLRSGIIRILKDCDGRKSCIIQGIIADCLKWRFAMCNGSISTILNVTNALCGCFDNFTLGVEGVVVCQQEAYGFIVDSLTLCKCTLSNDSSPSQSTELCQCIHVLVRAALNLCSMAVSHSGDQSQLHQLSQQLVACNQLPLDTRTNCGLLAVTTGRHSWFQMLKDHLGSGDDISSLCVYCGLIGCLSVEELSVLHSKHISCEHENLEERTPLQQMFDSIMDIHKRNPLQPVITLGVARTLVSLSRVLLTVSSAVTSSYVLPRLLLYVWEHLEHVMDSVKHLATTLLHNIANMHSSEVDVHGAILEAVRSLPVWGRARHTALSTLIGKVPVSLLVKGPEEINCLYEHLNREVISSHAVNAFQELLKHYYLETEDKEKWKELWVKPLLQYLDNNPSVPLQQVLTRTVTVCPDIVNYVLNLSRSQVSLGTTLLCLRHAHRLGLLKPSLEDSGKWKGLVEYDLLQTAANHVDEQTRLSCLSLIVEAPKTTEVFTPSELRLIMSYVSHNLNLESPASRQRNIALLRKFVSRLNDSRQVLERKKSNGEADQLIQKYEECKLFVEHSCVDSLFPGACYSRRLTALHLLTALKVAATPSLASALLICLTDSYEELKVMAMRLLIDTPGLLHHFTIPQKVLVVIDKSIDLAGGVKPPECLSAAYLLATLSQIPFSQDTLSAVVHKYQCCACLEDHDSVEYVTVYFCLLIVVERLTQQLSVARVSLLKAACSSPLYGLLFTVKLLLSQINLRACKSLAWKQLICRVIELSFCCSQAVASVVNNDSPEGHFPMDLDYIPAEGCVEGEEEIQGVTSQMVLLCSWRTVKEVSLLLGFLAEEASIADSPEGEGLLCSNDLLKIGDHLTTLLAETKHRGAFEQAYVGFCKLVSCLWRLPSGCLQKLPRQWLEDTMQEICNSNENLCATRRSAGIPFMIQALICTLLEVEGLTSIEPWVCRLLDMAESCSVPRTTHTHALNILRALFRNTQLGEAVSMFVERAIIITITAFSSSSWMERNSATLLLSALMTRVFGVPRSKSQDHLSWKNKMTGRIFFQRYPTLFEFFQQELKKASQLQSVNLHPSLYPVLLILGRLYPSSLEGTDSSVQLTQYIPDILVSAGSNIYKTRTLAATAMVALMSLSHFDSLISKATQPGLNTNLRHGLLLQVAYFFKHSDPKVDYQTFTNKAENWISSLTNLFISKLSLLEIEALFKVFSIFSEKYYELVPSDQWIHIMRVARHCLEVTKDSEGIVLCLLRPKICEMLLKLAVVRSEDSVASLCCELLQDRMYEVKHTVIDFISCLNSDTGCSERFCVFFKNLKPHVRSKFKCLIFDDSTSILLETFVQIVLNMLFVSPKHSVHSEDKAKILLVLRSWKRAFERILESITIHPQLEHVLLNLCRDNHDAVALSAVYCLTEFMCLKEGFPWQEENLTDVCDLLLELNESENSDMFNNAIYDLLSRQFEALQKSTQPLNRLHMYKTYIQMSSSDQWKTAVNRVSETEPDVLVTAVLLAALTLGLFTLQHTDQQSVGRVFDKGEVNDEYEEYMLSRISGQKLCGLCETHKDLPTRPLDPQLRGWLATETGLEGKSLGELVALAKLKVLQLDPDDPCQFISPGYQRLRLNSFKLKIIL